MTRTVLDAARESGCSASPEGDDLTNGMECVRGILVGAAISTPFWLAIVWWFW